jgi:RHS repeat-associated protein
LLTTDQLGSVRDVIDSNGILRIHRDFDSFGNFVETHYDVNGNVVQTPGATGYIEDEFAFTGRFFDDETGLQNNLNRWYDPSTGRWISEDPIGFAAGDPNLYRYVGNMPTEHVDPSGLESRDRDRRSDRRDERNARRRFGPILFDSRGYELFTHWVDGSGHPIVADGGCWGEYMQDNSLLAPQIAAQLESDAHARSTSGDVDISFSATIENGYSTGYEMLHGTNGGLTMTGHATVTPGLHKGIRIITYDVMLMWNDVIDPNAKYPMDTFLAGCIKSVTNPKDYFVHLSWHTSTTMIINENGKIVHKYGYPYK